MHFFYYFFMCISFVIGWLVLITFKILEISSFSVKVGVSHVIIFQCSVFLPSSWCGIMMFYWIFRFFTFLRKGLLHEICGGLVFHFLFFLTQCSEYVVRVNWYTLEFLCQRALIFLKHFKTGYKLFLKNILSVCLFINVFWGVQVYFSQF